MEAVDLRSSVSIRNFAVTQQGGGTLRRIDPTLFRALDIVVSFVAIIVLSPVFLLTALLVRCTSRGPILFAHSRIGLNGVLFPCLKFRTMVVDAQERLTELLANDPIARAEWERDHKLRNDPRVTIIGKLLRSSSLDELPQFFNVLRGEMSLVGPRPIVLGEVERYGRYFSHYCRVRPGITGLWQVSGRNDVNYRRRVAMDIVYVRVRKPVLNVKIILLTVPMVILARGSY